MNKYLFETETCSRCGGSGKYSFCEMYRDVCFKCRGQKVTYTKRGKAAQQFYIDLCTVSITEVKVGDIIQCCPLHRGSYRAQVVAVEFKKDAGSSLKDGVMVPYDNILLVTEHPKYGRYSLQASTSHTLRVYRQGDDERLKQALAYQESLTKQGKPRKKKTA